MCFSLRAARDRLAGRSVAQYLKNKTTNLCHSPLCSLRAGFTKSLARELGRANITVNTLAPGYMETNMTKDLQGDKLASIMRRSPLGRLAHVDDVAKAALFLLSESASSITGSTITVDAGSTA